MKDSKKKNLFLIAVIIVLTITAFLSRLPEKQLRGLMGVVHLAVAETASSPYLSSPQGVCEVMYKTSDFMLGYTTPVRGNKSQSERFTGHAVYEYFYPSCPMKNSDDRPKLFEFTGDGSFDIGDNLLIKGARTYLLGPAGGIFEHDNGRLSGNYLLFEAEKNSIGTEEAVVLGSKDSMDYLSIFLNKDGSKIEFDPGYYFSSPRGNRIVKANLREYGGLDEGVADPYVYFYEGEDLSAREDQLDDPVAFAVSYPNVYVADRGNRRIVKITNAGEVGAVYSHFGEKDWGWIPAGIAVDGDVMYVADSYKNIIVKTKMDGSIWEEGGSQLADYNARFVLTGEEILRHEFSEDSPAKVTALSLVDGSMVGHTVKAVTTDDYFSYNIADEELSKLGFHKDESIKAFGSGSYYFDGKTKLTSEYHESFDLSSHDWTIDFWARFNNFNDYQPVVSKSGAFEIYLEKKSADSNDVNVVVALQTVDNADYKWSFGSFKWINPKNNEWYHFAVAKSGRNGGGKAVFFIDGTKIGDLDLSGNPIATNGSGLELGYASVEGEAITEKYLTGYLDNFRLSRGVARWTSNFIPPYYFSDPGQMIIVDNPVLGDKANASNMLSGKYLYVVDQGSDRIVRIKLENPETNGSTFGEWRTFGEYGSGINQMITPTDIHYVFDTLPAPGRGRFYIIDSGNRRVIDTNGSGMKKYFKEDATASGQEAISFSVVYSGKSEHVKEVYVEDFAAARDYQTSVYDVISESWNRDGGSKSNVGWDLYAHERKNNSGSGYLAQNQSVNLAIRKLVDGDNHNTADSVLSMEGNRCHDNQFVIPDGSSMVIAKAAGRYLTNSMYANNKIRVKVGFINNEGKCPNPEIALSRNIVIDNYNEESNTFYQAGDNTIPTIGKVATRNSYVACSLKSSEVWSDIEIPGGVRMNEPGEMFLTIAPICGKMNISYVKIEVPSYPITPHAVYADNGIIVITDIMNGQTVSAVRTNGGVGSFRTGAGKNSYKTSSSNIVDYNLKLFAPVDVQKMAVGGSSVLFLDGASRNDMSIYVPRTADFLLRNDIYGDQRIEVDNVVQFIGTNTDWDVGVEFDGALSVEGSMAVNGVVNKEKILSKFYPVADANHDRDAVWTGGGPGVSHCPPSDETMPNAINAMYANKYSGETIIQYLDSKLSMLHYYGGRYRHDQTLPGGYKNLIEIKYFPNIACDRWEMNIPNKKAVFAPDATDAAYPGEFAFRIRRWLGPKLVAGYDIPFGDYGTICIDVTTKRECSSETDESYKKYYLGWKSDLNLSLGGGADLSQLDCRSFNNPNVPESECKDQWAWGIDWPLCDYYTPVLDVMWVCDQFKEDIECARLLREETCEGNCKEYCNQYDERTLNCINDDVCDIKYKCEPDDSDCMKKQTACKENNRSCMDTYYEDRDDCYSKCKTESDALSAAEKAVSEAEEDAKDVANDVEKAARKAYDDCYASYVAGCLNDADYEHRKCVSECWETSDCKDRCKSGGASSKCTTEKGCENKPLPGCTESADDKDCCVPDQDAYVCSAYCKQKSKDCTVGHAIGWREDYRKAVISFIAGDGQEIDLEISLAYNVSPTSDEMEKFLASVEDGLYKSYVPPCRLDANGNCMLDEAGMPIPGNCRNSATDKFVKIDGTTGSCYKTLDDSFGDISKIGACKVVNDPNSNLAQYIIKNGKNGNCEYIRNAINNSMFGIEQIVLYGVDLKGDDLVLYDTEMPPINHNLPTLPIDPVEPANPAESTEPDDPSVPTGPVLPPTTEPSCVITFPESIILSEGEEVYWGWGELKVNVESENGPGTNHSILQCVGSNQYINLEDNENFTAFLFTQQDADIFCTYELRDSADSVLATCMAQALYPGQEAPVIPDSPVIPDGSGTPTTPIEPIAPVEPTLPTGSPLSPPTNFTYNYESNVLTLTWEKNWNDSGVYDQNSLAMYTKFEIEPKYCPQYSDNPAMNEPWESCGSREFTPRLTAEVAPAAVGGIVSSEVYGFGYDSIKTNGTYLYSASHEYPSKHYFGVNCGGEFNYGQVRVRTVCAYDSLYCAKGDVGSWVAIYTSISSTWANDLSIYGPSYPYSR